MYIQMASQFCIYPVLEKNQDIKINCMNEAVPFRQNHLQNAPL